MISREGHVVLSNFRSARMLPVVERPHFSSPIKVKTTFGKITLIPDEIINLTPVYAAPELMEMSRDGFLEYDERVDWWSLGVTLYAIATGRSLFIHEDDLLPCIEKLLKDQVDLIQKADTWFCDFLRLVSRF